MEKIIVIGAGIGGLASAYFLGKAGFNVEVFEKEKEENLAYDWHDDVAPDIFQRLSIPLPDKKFYFPKHDWSFVPPHSKYYVAVHSTGERDISIDRKELSRMLVELAKPYAKINFGTAVQSLIIKDGSVAGVKVEGNKKSASLVIDSSGALSPFRKSLPDSFMIEKEPRPDEVFYAYRGFYERLKDIEVKEHTHKVYLRHLGEKGISWCRRDSADQADILIGRVDKLEKSVIDNALNELKKDSPDVGEKVVKAGRICVIPVRYPLLKMVGDGYAAIGDAAFMTIPMLGSGIASSLLAGFLLADTVIKGGTKVDNLWNYQVRFFHEAGAKHMGVDVLKRWMLKAESQDIKFLFERKVISQTDMERAGSGNLVKMPFKELLKKVAAGYSRLGLLLRLKKVIKNMQKAVECGLEIPQTYDMEAIKLWQSRVKKFYE